MKNIHKITSAMDVLSSLWPYGDGPAHIVHADFNLENSSISFCLQAISKGDTYSSEDIEIDHPVYVATKSILLYLLDIPEEDRLSWAEHAHEYVWRYGVGTE